MSERVDIIIPTLGLNSKDITIVTVKSFLKFNDGFDFKIHVVENSEETRHKNEILSLSDNINWIQNPINIGGSSANGLAIKRGLEDVKSDFVFMSHNDVAACHPNWMKYLYDKIKYEDHYLCGFATDPGRIHAIHIAGMLMKTELANLVDVCDFNSNGQPLDVGDNYTQYCRDNNLKYFCTPNTRGNPEEWANERCKEPFRSFPWAARGLDENNNVLYMHLGRGTPRTHKTQNKSEWIPVSQWISFVNSFLE